MLPLNHTLDWLLEKGYFSEDDDGWCSPVKPPSEADLAQYILSVSEMGRNSVATSLAKPQIWIRIDGASQVMQFKSSSKP